MGATRRTGGGAAASAKQSKNEPASQDRARRTCLHSQLHKTKFCMYHLKGSCQYGSSCAFAHSCAELQATPDLRKTRLCTTYANTGVCNDPSCSFAHGEDELRSTDMFYKKTLCMWNEKGKCRNGDQCRFAHGMAELRANGGAETVTSGDSSPVPAKAVGKAGIGKSAATENLTNELHNPEPMKIKPLQSLVNSDSKAEKKTLPSPAETLQLESKRDLDETSLHSSDPQIKEKIELLRQQISLLSIRCSHMHQSITGQCDESPMGFQLGEGDLQDESFDMNHCMSKQLDFNPNMLYFSGASQVDMRSMMNESMAAMLLNQQNLNDAFTMMQMASNGFGGDDYNAYNWASL